MKRLAVVALLAPLLAACSASSPTPSPLTANPPAPAAPAASATPTPIASPAEPAKSARGNLIKEVGQKAGVVDPAGNTLIDFTVTAIEPDFKCTSKYADPAKHGHFLAISLDITTSSDWNSDEAWMDFQSSAWSVISPEGKTENDSSGQGYMCVDNSEAVPHQIGPGEHVEGKVILDTAYTSGAIVLKIPGQSTGGWEWSFSG